MLLWHSEACLRSRFCPRYLTDSANRLESQLGCVSFSVCRSANVDARNVFVMCAHSTPSLPIAPNQYLSSIGDSTSTHSNPNPSPHNFQAQVALLSAELRSDAETK